jgi:glycosyltransferase involved in cell wall biosynthesis
VQGVGSDFCEIIIVDNASSDTTKEHVCSLARQNSGIKYIFEPVLGLSSARNTGIGAAKGRYIAYLDDDAVAEPGWLAQIAFAFEAGGPEVGCVAGKVSPIWGAPRPPWLHDALLSYIGAIDYAPQPIWLHDYQPAFGCNAAFPRDALIRVGGFSTTLGRRGASLLSNEEILLQRQLKRLGYRTYYDPQMAVRHHIHADRLLKSWFRRRAYWQGVSDAFLENQLEPMTYSRVIEKRLRRIASITKHPKELASFTSRGDDPVTFLTSCNILMKLGYGLASLHSDR